jgi:uncharacterized protein
MRKGTRSLVMMGTWFSALVLALVWTGSIHGVKAEDDINPTGTYTLLSVNGNSVPYTFTTEGVSITIKKGFFTINSDGTCIRNITLVSPNKPEISNDVKATYTLAGSTLTMKWERAGIMTGALSGNTFTMDNRGMVFVFQKGQAALYHKEVNDQVNTVNGKALIMVLDEVQRFDKFSIIRVKYASGAAAPSVMFTFRCNYEMAKLRKADYFILLKQWTDEKGDSMYKIGFSSDPKVDPSHYFGDAIDHNIRLSFLSVKESEELWDPVEALKSQNTQESSATIDALLKAAELSDAKSQFELSTAYLQGLGVPRDVAESLKWCRKAAEQGYAEAQTGLGGKYEFGVGVSKDNAEAVKWYRKAAEQGHAEAQFRLGMMYYPLGVMHNVDETIKWYRRAAEQGYAEAQLFLGFAYDEGRDVKQDYIQAHMWFSLAAMGHAARALSATRFDAAAAERAQQQLAEEQRDLIAKKMTRQQIAEAQQLAKEWKPKKE